MASSRPRQASRRSGWHLRGSAGGTFLLIITLLGIGAMYLAVSARAAEFGRQVLTLESQREDILQGNAELTAQLALLTAPEQMLARASELGFKPAGPQDVDYITVSGYQPDAEFLAPRPPVSGDIGQTALSPAYTETLGEWFSRVLGTDE